MDEPPVDVTDWATDYDLFHPDYGNKGPEIWDDLRQRCPVAQSSRWGGSHLVTRYADVSAVYSNWEEFRSRDVTVGLRDGVMALLPLGGLPVEADPPLHSWTRRMILPWFSNNRVAGYEESVRALCRGLIDGIVDTGSADLAHDYARQIPVRVISKILAIDEGDIDEFCEWVKVVASSMNEPEALNAAILALVTYLGDVIEERRGNPGDDLISYLLHETHDGQPIHPDIMNGLTFFVLAAGIETTWSAISSSMWHLATHPDDRRRIVADPSLLPDAAEEFLRFYAPIMSARIANENTTINGCPIDADEKVVLSIPSANRDPQIFPDADRVIIDRQINPHITFGKGIHRCAGSNLARMELRVAIEEWLARIPEFELASDAVVDWSAGMARGPFSVPVVLK